MANWFTKQRQDFIRAQLQTFGIIRREMIAKQFHVTIQIASKDIADFIESHPGLIDYDRHAKCYTLDKESL